MIKNIAAGIAGILLAVTPSFARIEDGTKPLIDLIGDSGIAVRFNTEECDSGEYLDVYQHLGMKRAFILCPGEDVDATDHMVVRHEAIHAIQHCVNTARGTSVYTAVLEDEADLMDFVRDHLSDEEIAQIKHAYPQSQWNIELEAFAGMHAYTSDDLAELFTTACLYTEG